MAHKTEIEVNGVIIEVTEFDHTAQDIDDAVDKIKELEEAGETTAVLYTAQVLTEAQQAQARTNINAVSVTEFNAALGEVATALSGMDEVIG